MTPREAGGACLGAVGLGRARRRLVQELDFHREMLEADHQRRGAMRPAAARRAARLELGGGAQIAEAWRDQRGLPFLDTLWQDVRYGFRMLRRTPGFTAAALAHPGARHRRQHGHLHRRRRRAPAAAAVPGSGSARDRRRPQRRPGSRRTSASPPCLDWRERSRSFEYLRDDAFVAARRWSPTARPSGCRPCASAGTTST